MRSVTLLLTATLLAAGHPSAQQVDRLRAAADLLGATSLKSLRLSGLGANFSVGQNPNPQDPWPRITIKSYDAAINYETASMRVEMLREQGPIPPRGGGQPFTGQQRLIQVVSGGDAWNVPLPPANDQRGAAPAAPPQPATTPQAATPPAAPQPATPPPEQPPQPQPAAAVERMLQIWLTPHGFLQAALANRATTRPSARGLEVAFTVACRAGVQGCAPSRFVGLLNATNQVEQVQTWIDNPVLGDMLVEAEYRDYEKVGGVWFPMHIIQRQGGQPSLELWITGVQPNAAVDIATPAAVRGATPPAVRVEAAKLAEGVYYLTGGSHHSVAIEMSDYIVLVEAPLDEARSLALIAKIKETIPNKPVRVVVNTHHHFDHAGGLRTFVDEGATIVTHDMNRRYYEWAWAAPRMLNPDRLARSGKAPRFQTFTDKHEIADGTRTVEIHRIANSPHHEGLAMVYLPREKLLIEADAYTPGADSAPAVAPSTPPAPAGPAPSPIANPTAINLHENIRRLRLKVERIAALHGPRVASLDDLARAIGR